MILRISVLTLLLAAGVTHAATPTHYQETYDAEGNRTWTKYLMDPAPGQIGSSSPYGGAAVSGSMVTPSGGTDLQTTVPLPGYGVDSGTRTQMLNNKYPENMKHE